MTITLLCDNPGSWIIPYVKELETELKHRGHTVFSINDHREIQKGNMLFILGCEKIIPKEFLALNTYNLVVHESPLPQGKGWSPLTWQILEGKNIIPVTLFEAVEAVDAGDIYLQENIVLDGTELLPEIKHKQGMMTKKLVLQFVSEYTTIQGKKQMGAETFYPRRTPKDSELDIHKSLAEQFNLLRVVDNERYPAFFYKNGKKYIIKIYEG